ncbi:MAG: hypothetical protein KF857_06500 [Fimbriimonadaceae bacterium]|nr:hypothetical protein [Fimbriimonadaceae bacterium]
MQTLWDSELTPDERDALVDKLVFEIKKRRMEAPAIFFLESHKPVAALAGHAMVAFAPFLVPFVGMEAVNDYSRLLLKRENVELVIQALEQDDAPRGHEATPTCNT